MKTLAIISLLTLAIFGCTSPRLSENRNNAAGKVMLDSSDYEIVIIDPEFERWYQLYYSPAQDRSDEFYRSKNSFAVSRWNDYYLRGKFRRAIGTNINYNPSIDYGLDVNRKLYWYFKYIQENYRVPLL
ncbi:MAG TPA: DUF6146 family protein [Lentimicrobium sp.]|nr:DUF6146 family protein [Lentimicrobium sp.]